MKAVPNQWGEERTQVRLYLYGGGDHICLPESEFLDIEEAKQIIVNLQAAIDTYEEENGTTAD